jgi:hypothetical protein
MKHQLLTLFVVLAALSVQAQQTHTALLAIDPGTACEGVGIGTVESDRLRIYPNPATDEVVIAGLLGGERIELYEMSGKLLQLHASMQGQRLDVSHLHTGIYLLRIVSDERFSHSQIDDKKMSRLQNFFLLAALLACTGTVPWHKPN